MSRPTRPAGHRRRRGGRTRGNAALTGTGLLIAAWLGLTAPSVSPVASPTTALHTVAHSVAVVSQDGHRPPPRP